MSTNKDGINVGNEKWNYPLYYKSLLRFSKNAYRIIEMPINASENNIYKKVDSISRKSRLGKIQHTKIGKELLGSYEISEKEIQYAVNKLMNPKQRLEERLFWFSDQNICMLQEPVGLDELMKIIRDEERAEAEDFKEAIYLHELSLIGLITLTVNDCLFERLDDWIELFTLIYENLENDEFWEYQVNIETNGEFSRPVKNELEECRQNSFNLLLEFLIIIIDDHYYNDDIKAFARGLNIISELYIPTHLKNKTINNLLLKVEDDIKELLDVVVCDCENNIIKDEKKLVENFKIYDDNLRVCKAGFELYLNKVLPKTNLIFENESISLDLKNRISDYISNFKYSLAINFTWGYNFSFANKLLVEAKEATNDKCKIRKIDEKIDTIRAYVEKEKLRHKEEKERSRKEKERVKEEEECKKSEKERAKQERESLELLDSQIFKCPACKFNVPINNKNHVSVGTYIFECPSCGLLIPYSKEKYIPWEGGFYSGQIKNKKPQGKGIFFLGDGFIYKGEWENGERNGYGEQIWPNGNIYIGNWRDNKIHGLGKFTWKSGIVYEGEWNYNTRRGYGKQIWPNGDIYTGQWRSGKMHGNGKYTWKSGVIYDGQWDYGKKHGLGKQVWPSGYKKEGKWINDEFYHNKKDYRPNFTLVDKYRREAGKSNRYDNSYYFLTAAIIIILVLVSFWYFNSNADDKSSSNWMDGSYSGRLSNGVPHGVGVLVWPDGEEYSGDFYEGKMHGYGTYTWPDGYKYEGEWDNNNMHGLGYLKLSDGTKLEGSWYNNELEGEVTITYPDGTAETIEAIEWE